MDTLGFVRWILCCSKGWACQMNYWGSKCKLTQVTHSYQKETFRFFSASKFLEQRWEKLQKLYLPRRKHQHMLSHSFASGELKDSWKRKTYFKAKIIEQYYTDGLTQAGFGYRAVPSSVTNPASPRKHKASTFYNRIAVLEVWCLSIPISKFTCARFIPPGHRRSPSWVHRERRCFLTPTWKQAAESANEFRRLLSLLLMVSLSLWDSSRLTLKK